MDSIGNVFEQHDDLNQQYLQGNFLDHDQQIEFHYDYERTD